MPGRLVGRSAPAGPPAPAHAAYLSRLEGQVALPLDVADGFVSASGWPDSQPPRRLRAPWQGRPAPAARRRACSSSPTGRAVGRGCPGSCCGPLLQQLVRLAIEALAGRKAAEQPVRVGYPRQENREIARRWAWGYARGARPWLGRAEAGLRHWPARRGRVAPSPDSSGARQAAAAPRRDRRRRRSAGRSPRP